LSIFYFRLKLYSEAVLFYLKCRKFNLLRIKIVYKRIKSYHFFSIIWSQPVNIPADMWEKVPYKKEHPIQVSIELIGATEKFDFDVMLVYDEA
jgi:hypothetical protein